MAIECYERVITDAWVEIPCTVADEVVTAWVNRSDVVCFEAGVSLFDSYYESPEDNGGRMNVPYRVFVRVLKRVLEAPEGASIELPGNGRFETGSDWIRHITTCGEERVFDYDDLNAFYDWLVAE